VSADREAAFIAWMRKRDLTITLTREEAEALNELLEHWGDDELMQSVRAEIQKVLP
jgi:hypothetical protein